ncbi:hypothetical protein [Streptomyces sp. NPDC001568]|uniref:hypothetical protein n=1 Tax=Streptomyces sp. NPDC001568 TaxID=3364588 RepID=UPI0036A7CF53
MTDTEKNQDHRPDTGRAERHLSYIQWVVPTLTGGLIILNALQGEQQRPTQQLHAIWKRARTLAPYVVTSRHWPH